MKVLVTGANGLLATHIIKNLLEKNYQVKGLLRSPEKFVLPEHENLELVTADINDEEKITKIIATVDAVIHAAALTTPNFITYEPYYNVNVLGTKIIVDACLTNHIKKLVYVSSANSIGFGTLENPGNETLPPSSPFKETFYAKSKYEGELLVLAATHKLNATVVNPTFMLGAFDAKPSSGKIILMAGKKIMFYPPGGKNFVNATEAAEGVIKALEIGKTGERYLLSGENLSYGQFFKRVQPILGTPKIMIKVPKPILLLVGYVGELLRFTKIKTPLSIHNMRILCVKNYYSNTKSQSHLQLEFTSINKGIIAAVNWFKHQKMR
ncbi:NAD-dependent epimerase/dehydratase family protein [Zhouia sp. PK063]|uniref:NAD-dependent epimerase/dehydratase family protein n=1 Tax=Zhouia sp. PK063 TaxID=3373602 RepID=UPI0037AFAE1F